MHHFELEYRYAKQRLEERLRQAEIRSAFRKSWKSQLATLLYGLAQRLEPKRTRDILAIR
jgi:hypothetical protein